MTKSSILSKAGHKVEIIDLPDGMKLFRFKSVNGQILSMKFKSTGTLEGDRELIRQAAQEDLRQTQRMISMLDPLWL